MAEKSKGQGALLVGGVGFGLGAAIALLIANKPAEDAPSNEKQNYLIECLTTLVPVLAEVAESNTDLITMLQQLLAAQGVAPPGVELSISTPWVAKLPEKIYDFVIRTIGTFFADKMVDYTRGKRLLIVVQSSLNQAANIQLIGNYVDDNNRATDLGGVLPCPANSNISVGLAWDDWHPFVGVRITTAVAPTAGILTIWGVVQE